MDRKQAYQQKLDARLDAWKAEIEKLEARAARAEIVSPDSVDTLEMAEYQSMNDRQLYESRMRARLNLWSAEIENLKARAKLAGEDLRDAANDKVIELRARHRLVGEKLGALGNSGDVAWEHRRADADAAAKSLKHALQTLRARI